MVKMMAIVMRVVYECGEKDDGDDGDAENVVDHNSFGCNERKIWIKESS